MVPLFVSENVVLEFLVADSKKKKETAWRKIEQFSSRFSDGQIQMIINHDTINGHQGRYARKASRILVAREDRRLRDGSAARVVAMSV